MIFSPQMQRVLKQELEDENPLVDGEIRRITRMGELYVSLNKEHPAPYYFQYTLEIDGKPHYFFGRKQ